MCPHARNSSFIVDDLGWQILEVMLSSTIDLIIIGMGHAAKKFLTKCVAEH